MTTLEAALTALQLAALGALAVFGFHRGWMALLAFRLRRQQAPPPAPPGEWPTVTVQLPVYNERYVAARLVEAAAALDYPRDRLQIQVLDDSDDDTSSEIRQAIARLPAGLDVQHIQRGTRTGYKAGALAHGLARATGECIAVFDADFVPPPDFLRRVVPLLLQPGVGMVQARWEHLNRDFSLLTVMQSVLLDGHFAVEHIARARAGRFFNFNGTAGVFRRRCIEDAGGWQHDTLTEDMDLSYRAQLAGWRFEYRPELACPAELPVDMPSFLNQQHRWAKGSAQTARKLGARILAAPVPLATRIEAMFHLLGNAAFPLLLLLILVSLPLQLVRLWNRSPVYEIVHYGEGAVLMLSTLCVLVYYGSALARLGRLGLRDLLRLPLVIALGAGLAWNNSHAFFSGLFGRTGEFRRTPKRNAVGKRDGSGGEGVFAYRSVRGAMPLLEGLTGLWALATAALGAASGLPATAAFHGLFGLGLLWVALGSARLHLRLPRQQPAPQEISA